MTAQKKKYEHINVAFISCTLRGGGCERVSLIVAKHLQEIWGIRSHFISNNIVPEEFILPDKSYPTVNTPIAIMPDATSFFSEKNKVFMERYFLQHNISIAFLVYTSPAPFQEMRKRIKTKFVYWCHVQPFWELLNQKELGEFGAKYSLKRWVQWHLLGEKKKVCSEQFRKDLYAQYIRDIDEVDKFITLCPEYSDQLTTILNLDQTQQRKLLPIINTIDLPPFIVTEKKKVIVYVARHSLVQKRFDRMFQIWKQVSSQLPDWTLKVYGSGPDKKIFEKMYRKMNLSRMEVCGYETDLEKIYSEASICLLTSTFEGWPLVIAEAQARGCIPFVFDCCAGMRHIIGSNQYAGCLIPDGDIETYSKELVKLCQDMTKQKKLQKNCLSRAKNWEHHINDEVWEELLKELIE